MRAEYILEIKRAKKSKTKKRQRARCIIQLRHINGKIIFSTRNQCYASQRRALEIVARAITAPIYAVTDGKNFFTPIERDSFPVRITRRD